MNIKAFGQRSFKTVFYNSVFAAVCVAASPSYAQLPIAGGNLNAGGQSTPQIAESACDPNYYETLEARAWMEAQREITQNQNLISRPLNTLQFSCFGQHMTTWQNTAKGLFSHDTGGGLGGIAGGLGGLATGGLGGLAGGLGGLATGGLGGLAGGLDGLLGPLDLSSFSLPNNLSGLMEMPGISDIANSLPQLQNFDLANITTAFSGIENLGESFNNLGNISANFEGLTDFTSNFEDLTSNFGDIGNLKNQLNNVTNFNELRNRFGGVAGFDKLQETYNKFGNMNDFKSALSTFEDFKDFGSVTESFGSFQNLQETISGFNGYESFTTAVQNSSNFNQLKNSFGHVAGFENLESAYNNIGDFNTFKNQLGNFNDFRTGFNLGGLPDTSGATLDLAQQLIAQDYEGAAGTILDGNAARNIWGDSVVLQNPTASVVNNGAGSPASTTAGGSSNYTTAGGSNSTQTGSPNASSTPPYQNASGTPMGGGSGSSTCEAMEIVWQQAQCANFIDVPARDGFFSLKEYAFASADKRPGCQKTPFWQIEYENVNNTEYGEKPIQIGGATQNVAVGTKWIEEEIMPTSAAFGVEGASNRCANSVKIPTGAIVYRDIQPIQYAEMYCLTPGCIYKPAADGNSMGTCVSSSGG